MLPTSRGGRCWRALPSPTAVPTPYFPVIELLKHYVRIEDSDDMRAMRAKVTGQVLTLDDALQDTLPALLVLLDVLPADSPFLQLDPPQRRQRTLEALKRLLLRESQVQPLLLIFEDLHWIDAETQALLDLLVDSLPEWPACCCWSTTARSTSTAGGVRPTTRNCASTHYPQQAPTHFSRRFWGTTPAWPPSSSC